MLGSSPVTFRDKAKRAVFELVFAVENRDMHHRVSTVGQAWEVLLLLVEQVQILVLMILPEFGFGHSTVLAAQSLSIKQAVLGSGWSLFTVGFGVAVFLVWAALLCLGWAHRSLASNPSGDYWAFMGARTLKRVVFGVGFVPIAHIISTPLSCASMAAQHVAELECGSGRHAVLVLTSIVTLMPYVTTAVVTRLLAHESDPNALAVLSQSSGYGNAAQCAMSFLTVLATLTVHRIPAAAALVVAGGFAHLLLWTSLHLPFYHAAFNSIASASYAFMSFLCVGAMISIAVGRNETLLHAWLGMCVLAGCCGAIAPRAQYRRLSKRLAKIRPEMLRELQQHYWNSDDQVSLEESPREGPQDSVSIEVDAQRANKRTAWVQQRHRRASIKKMTKRARAARYRLPDMPLGDCDDDVFDDTFDAGTDSSTPFAGLAAYEVDLLVRAELARPGNTDTRKRRRRFGRSTGAVPTTEAVEHVVYLFVVALDEFAEDPAGIAQVKIEYARFLHVYTADAELAVSALQGASREAPSFEGAFQVYSRLRRLAAAREVDGQPQQKHEATQEESRLRDIASTEGMKRLYKALRSHGAALRRVKSLLSAVTKHRRAHDNTDSTDTAKQLSSLVEAMSEATATANVQYRRLLASDPEVPGLASAFKRFCSDVLHNERQASQVLGQVKGLGTGQQQPTSSVGATYVPRKSSSDVTTLGVRFKIGIVVLLLIAVGMCVATHLYVETSSDHLATMQLVNTLRAQSVGAALNARTTALLHDSGIGLPPASAASLFEVLAEIKVNLLRAFYGVMDDHVKDMWDSKTLSVTEYGGGEQRFSTPMNLFSVASILLSDTLRFAGHPEDFHTNPRFRFLADNGVTVAVPAFERVIAAINEAFFHRVHSFWAIQIACFAAFLLALGVLGTAVFGRAVKRVQEVQRGVVEIATNIPPMTLARMRRRVRNGTLFVRQAQREAERVLNVVNEEEDDDRGMGDVDGFTYDADEEARPDKRGGQISLASLVTSSRQMTTTSINDVEDTKAGPQGHKGSASAPRALLRGAALMSRAKGPAQSSLAQRLRNAAMSVRFSVGNGFTDEPAPAPPRPTTGALAMAMAGARPPVEAVLKASPTSFVVTDVHGIVLFVNMKFARLCGVPVAGCIGHALQPEPLASSFLGLVKQLEGDTTLTQTSVKFEFATAAKTPRTMVCAVRRTHAERGALFVGAVAEVAGDVNSDDAQEDVKTDRTASRSSLVYMIKVASALVLVGLLQCVAMLHAGVGIGTAAHIASDVNNVARLRKLASVMKFACREAAIGDGEVWSAAGAADAMRTSMSMMSKIRYGLRFGDSSLGLTGSLGRDAAQDAIHLDAVLVDGVLVQGLDQLIGFYERDVDSCIRKFENGDSSVGANYFAVESLQEWRRVDSRYSPQFESMLLQSEDLYVAEAQQHGQSVLLANRLFIIGNVLLLLALYTCVFRGMIHNLLLQARCTEHFLQVIPRELGAAGPLKCFFVRVA